MTTKVVHSKSKPRWKVIGTIPGGLYNYAQVEYTVCDVPEKDGATMEGLNAVNKADAYKRALKISNMFNMMED